jgi:sugar O-acyltransferase (sialic acid O-acetyltransferase NeuD family)
MARELLIYGAGGAGRELAYALSLDSNSEAAWRVAGFIDDTEHYKGKTINGIPVLGGIEYLMNYSGNVVVTIVENPLIRQQLILKIRENDKIIFPLIVSAKANVSPYVEFGEGCIVSPLNFVQPNIKIGKFVWLNGGNRIGHDSMIGDYTTVYSAVLIGGGVSIGKQCVIGSGAIILPNVKIGDGSIIGAGALVNKNIPQNVIAAGVPAKIIKELTEK